MHKIGNTNCRLDIYEVQGDIGKAVLRHLSTRDTLVEYTPRIGNSAEHYFSISIEREGSQREVVMPYREANFSETLKRFYAAAKRVFKKETNENELADSMNLVRTLNGSPQPILSPSY
ncbi:MAG: hypothetical protein WCK29_00915 [archaeon]